jgi:peptidylprolyl isomerase
MRDGQMFDSSVLRQKPEKVRLDQVIPGWREALSLMVVGEKRRAWVPANLAFGAEPRGPNQPYGDLTYDIELLKLYPVPHAPPDVRRPPPGTPHTLSGIAFRVLRAGSGTEHAAPRAAVEVRYTGWTTDGHAFASTSADDTPSRISPAFWPDGLAEAVLMMVEGEVTRYWIPAKLAASVAGPPGGVPRSLKTPGGIVVYDIELTKVFPMHWH